MVRSVHARFRKTAMSESNIRTTPDCDEPLRPDPSRWEDHDRQTRNTAGGTASLLPPRTGCVAPSSQRLAGGHRLTRIGPLEM